jgi:hypothetical protein
MPAIAMAAGTVQECPLIRPPGLTPEQVDAVVMEDLSRSVSRVPQDIDRSKSFAQLDPGADTKLHFALFVVHVSEALGIEDGVAFHEIAAARHNGNSMALTVQEYLDASRAAYARGTDGPPPAAIEGVRYKLSGVMSVPAPSPARGWSLVACRRDQVGFQRVDGEGRMSMAYVSSLGLPPFKDAPTLAAYAREQTGRAFAKFGEAKTLDVLTSGPNDCADFRYASATLPVKARGRTCYENAKARHGYGAYFMHIGEVSDEVIQAETEQFVGAVFAAKP